MKQWTWGLVAVLVAGFLAWSPRVMAEEPEVLSELLPKGLVDAQGQAVPRATLKGKIVALYFSAKWCPPCRAFSPVLVAFRDKHAAEFEVVLVSLDRTAKDLQEYMRDYQMKWLAVPFTAPQRGKLPKRFEVQGIPTLVIVDATGKVIDGNGVKTLMEDGDEALAKWRRPDPVKIFFGE